MIPDRLLKILRSCEVDQNSHFPPTEIYNEGWMLRLVLDAIQTLDLRDHPLGFADGAKWYSEALLSSPFKPRSRADKLAEGFTNADGVIGHFEFGASTKSGLRLHGDAKQFVVVEAKMFSNLSAGTTNARVFDQAARNVACIAEAISQSARSLNQFDRLGFFVLAPSLEKRNHRNTNLEACIDPNSIKLAVRNRIQSYEQSGRDEAKQMRDWERDWFFSLIDKLVASNCLRVISWEDCIEAISMADGNVGAELGQFYQRCLTYAPPRQS